MSLFKCKFCGGDLEIEGRSTVTTCKYCRTTQTLPKTADDNLQNLFNRASVLRQRNEFDKAEALYERILETDDTEAEAYWGTILCKFGIEYVEDAATKERIPTCHRASYDSIVADGYYKKAIEYADESQKPIYISEARKIDEIQKRILAISNSEKPYDVFICYKETDENGKRTPDSVIANDLYHQLTQEGLKVFFARITLEEKLGQEYEPYIFSALNSAKVMVVVGTRPEYFNAVWVKNEWSRYLALIKQGQRKMLVPAYKDMDPYDLPDEFSHLQAQDMSKLGFMQDLIRGIKKITETRTEETAPVKETSRAVPETGTAPLIKRAFMFLADGAWKEAETYCEKVLDIDPENAEAYLGKLMAKTHSKTKDDLKNCAKDFSNDVDYKALIRFSDDSSIAFFEEREKELREKKSDNKVAMKILVKFALLIILCMGIFQVLSFTVGYTITTILYIIAGLFFGAIAVKHSRKDKGFFDVIEKSDEISDEIKDACKKVRYAFKEFKKSKGVVNSFAVIAHLNFFKNAVNEGNRDRVISESEKIIALLSEEKQ